MTKQSEIKDGESGSTTVIIMGEERNFASRLLSYLMEKSGKEKFLTALESASLKESLAEIPAEEEQNIAVLITSIMEGEPADFLDSVKTLPEKARIIFCYDQEELKKIFELSKAETFTFGFQEGANLRVSDLKRNGKTNFKINYKGNSIPIWIALPPGEKSLYAVLAAVSAALTLGLNAFRVSQLLRSYS